MASIRQVCDRLVIPVYHQSPLKGRRQRRHRAQQQDAVAVSMESIPVAFLDSESDAELIQESWNNLVESTNALARSTRWIQNRNLKKTVFESGMENICTQFGRRTENVKVGFVSKGAEDDAISYSLDVIKLRPLPDEVRNPVAPSMTAEVPPQYFYREQRAEYVGAIEVETPATALPSTTDDSIFADDAATAPIVTAQVVVPDDDASLVSTSNLANNNADGGGRSCSDAVVVQARQVTPLLPSENSDNGVVVFAEIAGIVDTADDDA